MICAFGYPYKYACADQREFMRMHMSSGTTGTPIINPYTPHDIRQWGNIMARCYAAAGIGEQRCDTDYPVIRPF